LYTQITMTYIFGNLYGGLGNQLFQIAATISYALYHSMDFQFKYSESLGNRPTYWNTFLYNLKSKTCASIDCSNLPVVDEATFDKLVTNGGPADKLVTIGGSKTIGRPADKLVTNSGPAVIGGPAVIDGYFQSPRFFTDHQATIFEWFSIYQHQRITMAKYNLVHKSISIHFRRGDYKALPLCHPILPNNYYAESIYYILSQDPTIHQIYYYCEDEDATDILDVINELKHLFSGLKWSRPTIDADWEEMVCMSCSKHNVIANSSFSWWGAYFNDDINKIVCYPSTWFGPLIPKDVSSMFPSTWTQIPA